MLKNKRIRYISIVLGVVIIIVGFFLIFRNPTSIIEGKFHIKLPSNTIVINHEYNMIRGRFAAKLEIEPEAVESIREGLIKHFIKEDTGYKTLNFNYENSIEGWNISVNNIITAFSKPGSDDTHLFLKNQRTVEVFAYITKDNEDQYFLYVLVF